MEACRNTEVYGPNYRIYQFGVLLKTKMVKLICRIRSLLQINTKSKQIVVLRIGWAHKLFLK